jgi:hypothetical protein
MNTSGSSKPSSRDNKYRNYYHWWPAEKEKPTYRWSFFDVKSEAWKYDNKPIPITTLLFSKATRFKLGNPLATKFMISCDFG